MTKQKPLPRTRRTRQSMYLLHKKIEDDFQVTENYIKIYTTPNVDGMTQKVNEDKRERES